MLPQQPVPQPTYYRAPALPLRKVRIVRAGWYGPGKKPVTEGAVIELPADDARGAVATGRAEYAK
ncbi:MAG: hypothetical protein ACLPQ6_03320 [Steroidobacteraceae bacterium]